MATGDPTLRFVRRGEAAVLEVSGTWTVLRLGGVRRHAEKARAASGIRGATAIDARGVERLDTAGVLEILSLSGAESDSAIEARDEAQADLFRLVRANLAPVSPAPRVRGGGLLVDLGQGLADAAGQFVRVSTFFGEVMAVLARAFLAPRRFRPPAVVAQAYEVWIRALGIVGVLCFLIGVVLAYQGVQQLRQFGAETFTVETVGISIFRELGVLLTANRPISSTSRPRARSTPTCPVCSGS